MPRTTRRRFRLPVYHVAAQCGYPYIRGEGRPSLTGKTWLGRFTKTADGTGPALILGHSEAEGWVVQPDELGPPGDPATGAENARIMERLEAIEAGRA